MVFGQMSARVTRALRLMKAIPLLGWAAFVALAIPAMADDRLRVTATSIPPVVDWTGLYIGLNAGYGFGTSQTDALFSNAGMGTPLFATSTSSRLNGVIGGAQTGYNWQSGSWLIGLETDIQATNQRATKASCNPTIAGFDAPVGIWHYHKVDWFSTLRGRLGVIVTPDSLVRSRYRPETAPSWARYPGAAIAICDLCSCRQPGSC
jgi:outer membrane immunogenic protein